MTWTDFRPRGAGRGALRCAPALLGLAFAAACDTGGKASTAPGAGVGPALAVDFHLRRDVRPSFQVQADVRAHDLNDDGLVDLVQANAAERKVLVAFGLPDERFVAGAELATAGVPWRSAIGDLDADGRPDVVVLSVADTAGGSAAVEAFLQEPTPGVFAPAVTHPLTGDPDDLAVAPAGGVPGVGDPDEVFVAVSEERRVLRLGLDGAGAFELVGELDSASLGIAGEPFSVAVFDLLGDDVLDLAVAEARVGTSEEGRVLVYRRGPGGFEPPEIVVSPVYWPTVDEVGDVAGTGFDALAVSQVDSGDVQLLLGGPDGLESPLAVSFGPGTTSAFFPDVDGDDVADAVATVFAEGAIHVRMASRPLEWGEATRYEAGYIPRAVSGLLLPGDELADLIAANVSATSLLVNEGDGAFRSARGFEAGAARPARLALGDLDGDGDVDAVVLSPDAGTVSFLAGAGDGTLELVRTIPAPRPVDAVLVDLDDDALPEVLVAAAGSDELLVLRNPGSIDGFAEPTGSDVVALGAEPRGLGVGDLDGDELADVVAALEDAVAVLLGTAGGGLDAPRPTAVDGALGVRVADLDGDERPDVVARVAGVVDPPEGGSGGMARPRRVRMEGVAGGVVLLRGDGAGGLVHEAGIALGATASLAAADVDVDGLPDLVLGRDAPDGEVLVLQNRGGFAFEIAGVPAGRAPANVLVLDADEDGPLDLVVATAEGELAVLLGDGSGGFPDVVPETPGELALLRGVTDVALADLDGDGLPDLVYVSPSSPLVWVGRNASVER